MPDLRARARLGHLPRRPRRRLGQPMNELLGALGLADDGLTDVGGDGLALFLGGRGNQGGFVVAEVDAQHFPASVGVLGSAGHWGHVSQSSESTRGMSTGRVDAATFPRTITSMKTTRETPTAYEVLMQAMATNPDLIRSVIAIDDDHADFDHLDSERESIVARIAASEAAKPAGLRLINRIPGFGDVR